jgi:hypothetical protein
MTNPEPVLKRVPNHKRWNPGWALAIVVSEAVAQPAAMAEGFDIGAGLGFISERQGLEAGWDVEVGYEFKETERVSLGVQWEWINGWTSENRVGDEEGMSWRSNALYLTMRPKPAKLRWLQLKAGMVNANYKIADFDNELSAVRVSKDNSGTGIALGVGLVLGSDKVRLHLLDYQHYVIDGDKFDSFGLSLTVLGRY